MGTATERAASPMSCYDSSSAGDTESRASSLPSFEINAAESVVRRRQSQTPSSSSEDSSSVSSYCSDSDLAFSVIQQASQALQTQDADHPAWSPRLGIIKKPQETDNEVQIGRTVRNVHKVKRIRVREKKTRKPYNRINAWNGPSYTDLITEAIRSSKDGRMIVAEIYDWITKRIPYFHQRKDCESSQGWKNAVRHTLSLRRRFVRVPKAHATTPWYNSYWTIDEDSIDDDAGRTKPRKQARIPSEDCNSQGSVVRPEDSLSMDSNAS